MVISNMQSVLDVMLRGRLQNLGITEQGACNGDTLALTTREERTLCTNESIEAIRKGGL